MLSDLCESVFVLTEESCDSYKQVIDDATYVYGRRDNMLHEEKMRVSTRLLATWRWPCCL